MLKELKEKFLPEKWPSLRQCRRLFDVLDEKEKSTFQIAGTVFLVSLVVLGFFIYYQKTTPVPTFGGRYAEGMIGQPQLLNPIYSSANDIDRDISSILFSGILKHDLSGNIIPELAERVSSDGNVFKITLKEGLRWSDGEKLMADDVVFTVETIQNSKTRSPLFPEWIGIKVEKVSDLEIRFYLEQESPIFPNRLFLQLIPKHIWESVSPERFPLSKHNLKPIGSGPYRIKSVTENRLREVESITLETNPYYHGEKPKIEEISFVFFNTEENLISASRRKEIQGFAIISPKDYERIAKATNFTDYSFRIPRVFGLFFNLEGELDLIKDREFREALNYGTDKESLLEKILSSRGQTVTSPFLAEIYNFDFSETHQFDIQKANEMLDNMGLVKNEYGIRENLLREERTFEFTKDLNTGSQGEEVRQLQKCLAENEFYQADEITGFYGDETKSAVINFQEEFSDQILDPWGFSKGTGMVAKSTRAKLNELCSFTPGITAEIVLDISTVDQPLMLETAEEIKIQWEKLGIRVNISLFEISSLESNVIKPRNYEILLFGKAFDAIPDYFPFWHSSQKNEYGFNLSMYSNKKADQLLTETRTETDKEVREKILKELHDILVQDIPSILLFNPDYIVFFSERIKGISPGVIFNPSQRFYNIENWYIKTKRVKK